MPETTNYLAVAYRCYGVLVRTVTTGFSRLRARVTKISRKSS